jgi:hypothetical protein
MGMVAIGKRIAALGCWSTVRAFGNIKYFNISYAVLFGVPLVHELYAKSVPFMKWFGAPAPFPTTLRWVYGASFAFAIAIALYQWRCPELIKRFGRNDDEYLNAEYEGYKRALANKRLNVVLANLDPELDHDVYERITKLLNERMLALGDERANAQKELDEIVTHLHPDAVQRYLLRNYERLNESAPVCRLTSFALYLLGTGILLVLLFWKSYGVLLTS